MILAASHQLRHRCTRHVISNAAPHAADSIGYLARDSVPDSRRPAQPPAPGVATGYASHPCHSFIFRSSRKYYCTPPAVAASGGCSLWSCAKATAARRLPPPPHPPCPSCTPDFRHLLRNHTVILDADGGTPSIVLLVQWRIEEEQPQPHGVAALSHCALPRGRMT